ncbi:MAG TPA: WD40 repeat domain-containing protein, partial [Gemmata sp.]|nr:WD40 repeat domain-containing protein [Gemmata sp.]
VIRSMKTLKTFLTLGALTLITGGLLAAGTLLPREPEKRLDPNVSFTGEQRAPARHAGVSPWRETKVLEHAGWLAGSVCFSPEGKQLFVGGTEGQTRSYLTASWKKLWEYKSEGKFSALAPSPDGNTLGITYSSDDKRGVLLVDAATGKAGDRLEELGANRDWPEPIAVGFFPDQAVRQGNEVIATSRKVIFGNTREYIVKTWLVGGAPSTIKSSLVAAGKQPADEYALPIAVSPDGKRVVVTGPVDPATGKNVLWAWSAGSGAGNKLLEGHKAAVISSAWSKDGKLIVTGDAQGMVIAWDAATFKEKSRVMFPPGRVAAVAVSDDGKQVAAAVAISLEQLPGKESYSEEVFIWPSDSPPKQPTAISRHSAGGPFKGIASIAFSPDGKTLVSAFCNFVHLSRTGELNGKVRVFTLEASRR